jgi:hypothetical protein
MTIQSLEEVYKVQSVTEDQSAITVDEQYRAIEDYCVMNLTVYEGLPGTIDCGTFDL